MSTVVGLFASYEEAQAVVADLIGIGLQDKDISIIANDAKGRLVNATSEDNASTGAGTGAAIGTVAGLVLGLGALAIPGIGPVIAIGPLAAALTGAGLGAATGSLLGALSSVGVPEDQAQVIAEGIRRGHALVAVHTDEDHSPYIADTLRRMGAAQVDEREAEYRSSGWTGFREESGDSAGH